MKAFGSVSSKLVWDRLIDFTKHTTNKKKNTMMKIVKINGYLPELLWVYLDTLI